VQELAQRYSRELPSNLLKGLGLGIGIAVGFTVWITFLRLNVGTKPFDDLDTTYSATVALYFGGGAIGGLLIGPLLPLHRWPWGSALLGMLGVFPLYFGVELTKSPPSDAWTFDNVLSSAFAAFLVGGAVGIWSWLDDNPHAEGLMGALRHPTKSVVTRAWVISLLVATGSYILLPRWTGAWNPRLMLFTAFVMFVIPLGVAVLVTLAWIRTQKSRTGS
jgi:hypothetical protein